MVSATHRWIERSNALDVERALAMVAPNATMRDVLSPMVAVARYEIRHLDPAKTARYPHAEFLTYDAESGIDREDRWLHLPSSAVDVAQVVS